ncbi:hypothetical protein ONZ45_g2885 [Pleurotus djamor]|nr:hypothetical protein ONZ45_g16442 [Pleurotus djamor]KAJ8520305.1 hypothetical protein ONZ45_g2885 [Pleurotus djamor]
MTTELVPMTLMPSPRVPNEILDRIVVLALNDQPKTYDPVLPLDPLEPVKSLSLASKSARAIVLRRFLENTTILKEKSSFWKLLCYLDATDNGGFNSVRTLKTNSKTLSRTFAWLASFTRLQALQIDLATEGLSTQSQMLRLYCHYLWNPAPTNSTGFTSAAQLTALKLTSLARIDLSLLRLLTTTFPALIHLHLSCSERICFDCCWNCCVDTAECVIHSPIPDMLHDANELAIQFSLVLNGLKNLECLHLGLFLTPETFFYQHVEHAGMEAYQPAECDICKGTPHVFSGDSDLTDGPEQMILEPGAEMEAVVLQASLIFAKNIRSLARISWAAWLGKHGDVEWRGEGESDQATNIPNTIVWVQRQAGRVRLRTKPCSDNNEVVATRAILGYGGTMCHSGGPSVVTPGERSMSDGTTSDFEQLLRSFENFRKNKHRSRGSLASSYQSRESLGKLDVAQFLKKLISPRYHSKNEAGRATVLDKETEDEISEVASIISTGKFPTEGKKYPFTFKLMIHKLYALEDWAQKVKSVLDVSQRQFRPLAEDGATKTEGIASQDHGDQDDQVIRQVGGRRPFVTRARCHSSIGYGRRKDHHAPFSPTKPTFSDRASPIKTDLSHQEHARAIKKRCVGRRKSLGALGADAKNQIQGALGSWVYDAAVSSRETPDTVSRRRALAERVPAKHYGELEGPEKMPRVHKRRVSSATGEWKSWSAAKNTNWDVEAGAPHT